MKIAIVILNYNSAADCRKCIADLKRQTGIDAEIVVVDNCSREDDRRAAEQLCRENGCTFIASAENRGYNAGNNIGLRHAAEKGYEFAMICNPDMEFPQADYIDKLLAPMLRDKNIAVCGSDIRTPEGVHQNPRSYSRGSWLHSFRWVKDIFRKKDKGSVPDWVADPHVSRHCRGLNGCCLLLRISFVRQIGYFEERIFLYGEEPVLARQAEMAGKSMFYTAEASAIHNHRKSKEGGSAFCSGHWRHSQLVAVRYYSGYPFYGKWFAMLSVVTYFLTLNLYHRFRGYGNPQDTL